MSRMDRLFFFDEEVSRYRRKYKRYRKPPELLPFSVRLTGLSGAVRVEAYLKQQQKAKEGKNKEGTAEKIEQEQGEVTASANEVDTTTGGQAGAEQNQAVLNNLYKLGDDLKQEVDENKEKKSIRFPTLGLKNFGATGIKNFEQLEGDDEEEDTQRFLFEENKFAAPNLLAQLGKLLDFLHGKQVEELEDILSTSSQLDSPSIVVENSDETQTLRGGGVVLNLSEELTQKLLNNYEGLSANAVYVKREWQTASYREQAILLKRLGNNLADFQQLPEGSRTDIKIVPTTMQDSKKDGHKLKGTESKDSVKKSPKKDQEVSDAVLNSSGMDLLNEGTVPQILNHQRDSKSYVPSSKPRTRLEKFKFYIDKPDGSVGRAGASSKTSRRHGPLQGSQTQIHQGHGQGSVKGSVAGDHVHFDEQTFYEDDGKDTSEVPSTTVQIPGQPSVINFSLLSRQCEDKGWVIHQSGADDLERQTMIEWARARLLQVIKERDEAAVKAKELGEDGPVLQKYYGDAQLEAALKYKKGVSWAKRWTKMTENDKKSKFLISVPDGTTFCYYPSGRMAVCAINPGPGLPGRYTFVYGDSDDQPMLATFTPTGLGCCYNTSGNIRFVATAKFGALMEEDGKLEKKWRWPVGKLQTSVAIQLNQNITFRCTSQTGITLYFNCQNETTKFSVGMVPGAKTIKIEELGYLQTDSKFTSLAALQSIKVKPRKRDKRRKTLKIPKIDAITEDVIEERQKELEEKFPERKEIELDAPFQLELLKLQRKIKNLVYDWMDHYRISVGIVSPKRAYRRSLTHSAKSLPGSMPSTADRRRGTLSGRSPSAPPIPRAKALTSFRGSPGPHSPTRSHSSAGERPSIRRQIDGDGVGKGVTLDVPQDGRSGVAHLKTGSTSGSRSHSMSQSRVPFRCGLVQQPRSLTPPKKGCCVALRAKMLGEQDAQCRCDRRRIPLITDLEYDVFLKDHVARTQMVVISVTSSLYPDANPCDGMLDQLFYEKNRNRSISCIQARNDPFRLLRYDIAVAALESGHAQPLLLTRHNAVPGMFLMYVGARLLFADHIFNGYGNAKKDFLKQIMKTRKDSLVGNVLPYDFRLTPTRGRSGPRVAWGGEIGGPKLSNSQLATSTDNTKRITSACTQESQSTATIDNRGGAQSAASFINFGLSIDSPYPLTPKPIDSLRELPKLNTVA